jgi:endonuclease YncB( thermonuclease family)
VLATAWALVSLLAASVPGATQTITDGDTIKQGGVTYRLWGIDAPESAQTCADGWPAGSLATTRLKALT